MKVLYALPIILAVTSFGLSSNASAYAFVYLKQYPPQGSGEAYGYAGPSGADQSLIYQSPYTARPGHSHKHR